MFRKRRRGSYNVVTVHNISILDQLDAWWPFKGWWGDTDTKAIDLKLFVVAEKSPTFHSTLSTRSLGSQHGTTCKSGRV